MQPYANSVEFGLALKHADSLVNFIAAYGTDPTIRDSGPDGVLGTGDDVTTLAAKRLAAAAIVAANGPLMTQSATTSGLDLVDFWVGGMAEKPAVFGGLLGSTFNFVFEHQLESLQDGDRFYYLQRTDGLNLRFSLEGNSLAEMARRNTTASGTMDIIFSTPDFTFDVASLTGTDPIVLGDPADGITLQTLTDGTKFFFDANHTGKNIVFNGTPGDDRLRADVGDDTFYGNAGNDRMDGAEGNDTLLGGDGDDILFGQNGDDIAKGGPGERRGEQGPGFGGDLAIGGEGTTSSSAATTEMRTSAARATTSSLTGRHGREGIFGGAATTGSTRRRPRRRPVRRRRQRLRPSRRPRRVGGDDVLGWRPGQDNHFGEGGDDIFLMSEGSNKFFGDYGFDWITQRGWPAPADIAAGPSGHPGRPLNFGDLGSFYRLVYGASGWAHGDHIRGDKNSAE